jgi:glutathione S-transferase
MIKLYVFLGSPRAFNVMAVANHLGIEYQTQALNPAQGEHLAPAYAAINPNKRIPTLEEDGFVLWEANAITQYLASKKPEAGLLPADPTAACGHNTLAVLVDLKLGTGMRGDELRASGQEATWTG